MIGLIVLIIIALGICITGLYLAFISMGWIGVFGAIAMGILISILSG